MTKLDRWPLVVVGILNWNRWDDSIACLESVLSSHYEPLRVVILDNGSSDNSVEKLRQWSTARAAARVTADSAFARGLPSEIAVESLDVDVQLARSADNLGFAGGCNVLARIAGDYRAEYLWLLNNDATVEVATLGELVKCAQRESAVVGSLVLGADNNDSIEFARGRLPHDFFGWTPWRSKPGLEACWPSDWVTFASVLVPLHLIRNRVAEHGHFLDDRLFMYVEDMDFCMYARLKGVAVYVSRPARIRHKRAASSGGKRNPRTYYYITRNRLLVARKWFSAPMRTAFITHYLCSRVALQTWHALLGRWAVVRAVAEGVADGMLNRGGRWHRH